MSTPLDRASDRDCPSLYAPKWARTGTSDERDGAQVMRGDESLPHDGAQPAATPGRPDGAPADDGLRIERYRGPRSLEPTVMPQPWSQPRGRSALGTWTRLVAAISAAAVVALFVVGRASPNRGGERIAEASPAPVTTRLVIPSVDTGEQPGPPAPQLAVVAPVQDVAAPAVRRLDPEEVAALIRRGEGYLANGDLAAARLLLQRAAEAQDARAALALAATYDPAMLAQLGVRGSTADAATARVWYEKARQFGSVEASRRLELLASSTR